MSEFPTFHTVLLLDKTQQTEVKYFSLDVIISVGYRVKSQQGPQFRIWATKRLKEHIIKGFTLNDDRFKSGNSMNYKNAFAIYAYRNGLFTKNLKSRGFFIVSVNRWLPLEIFTNKKI